MATQIQWDRTRGEWGGGRSSSAPQPHSPASPLAAGVAIARPGAAARAAVMLAITSTAHSAHTRELRGPTEAAATPACRRSKVPKHLRRVLGCAIVPSRWASATRAGRRTDPIPAGYVSSCHKFTAHRAAHALWRAMRRPDNPSRPTPAPQHPPAHVGGGAEHAIGQVLDGKVRVRRDLDERLEGRHGGRVEARALGGSRGGGAVEARKW